MKKTAAILMAGALIFGGRAFADPVNTNLLTNPGAENSMTGWNVTAGGGDGWTVFIDPGFAQEGSNYWATSYQFCIMNQSIDLLSKGFSTATLDASPEIEAGVYINNYWGGQYFLNITLQDASHNTVTNYALGSQGSPIVDSSWATDTSWHWIGTTFSGYEIGIRYVVFEVGGRDYKNWGGYYGTRFDGAEVSVIPEPSAVMMLVLGGLLIAGYRRFYGRI